jgi:hypothetical protein
MWLCREKALQEAYQIVVDGKKFEVVQVETLLGLPSIQPEEQTAKVEVNEHPCGVSGKCGACDGDVYNEDPYCSHCGCRLEW